MGTQQLSIIFRGSIDFVAPPPNWWKDTSGFEAFRQAMERAGLWIELPYIGRSARKLRRSPDPAGLFAWTT